MPKAPYPRNEDERLETLRQYQVLDTAPEPGLDAITASARSVAGVSTSLVSLIDADRQWFKSRRGMEATETHRDQAFCAHAILQDEPMIVPDASADERFMDNPLVTAENGIRFYAGFQLRAPNGHALGTMCVIDSERRELSAGQQSQLTTLARQAETYLGLRHVLLQADSAALAANALVRGVGEELVNTLQGMLVAESDLWGTTLDPGQQASLQAVSQGTNHIMFLMSYLQTQMDQATAGIEGGPSSVGVALPDLLSALR
ncbi:MAG: GAF domain-containing protein [Actinomycetota bacterium]